MCSTILGGVAPTGPGGLEELVAAHQEHWNLVAGQILKGKLTPFLGSGVNRMEEPGYAEPAVERLPDGRQLARDLHVVAEEPELPLAEDLAHVSQYIDVMLGWENLYEHLRSVFAGRYRPTLMHRLIASLPPLLRARGASQQLIVTTNYDDALERAFEDAGEAFDVVVYIAHPDDPHRGAFRHFAPDGSHIIITEDIANRHRLPLDQRPCILKVHGTVDRADASRDGYVIAEDDYIDFLAGKPLSTLLPVTALERLKSSATLFLAYRLEDWNLRVFFRRLWGEGMRRSRARWAVQLQTPSVVREYWAQRKVQIVELPLDAYLAGLVVSIGARVAPEGEGPCAAPEAVAGAPERGEVNA